MAAIAYRSHARSDYRLLGLVGQGQFAQVYCGVHRLSGQLVAIKQTRHASEHASQEPFILNDLSHPNVIGCQAIAQVNDGYQFILDYCEGGTLRSHLDTASPLSLAETKTLMGDILQGLAHIHQQHIVHGDLKPENIFLTHTPFLKAAQQIALTAKIGDFGSARFVAQPTGSRREIGSPTYAAPERFEGISSYACDLYSVGVMLYELLLGDRPFSGNPEALRQAHQTQLVPLPDTLTQPAMQLLRTALHKQPDKRFTSAEAMLSALRNLSAVYLLRQAHSTTMPMPAQPVAAQLTAAQPTAAQPTIPSINRVAVTQSLTRIPPTGISDPIESLVTIPQGCCIITARSLHVLTPQQQLIPIAQFDQACWIAVSPNGRWFVTLSKQPPPKKQHGDQCKKQRKSQGHFYVLSQSDLFSESCPESYPKSCLQQNLTAVPRSPLVLTSSLLTALCSDIVQVLAIDARHFLQVRTVQLAHHAGHPKRIVKTYLECFTRRGQFVGQLSLNLWITHMTPTAVPYQFIALVRPSGAFIESTDSTSATVALITLKPLQVRHLRLQISPEQVSAFPWGCLITGRREALLLDRSPEPMSWLTGLPPVSAIAAMGDRHLLMASTSDLSALVMVDLTQLDLDLIF